jgi:hypothetical protein
MGGTRWIAAIHPRLAVVLHDLVMVWLAWFLANLARYALRNESNIVALFSLEIPIVLVAQGAVLYWTGLYRGLWRFASLPDLWNIARAALIGTLAIVVCLFLFSRLQGVPRSVLFLYPVILVVLLGAPRMLYRFWKDSRYDAQHREPARRVLVLGAGRAGEALVRELRRENRYVPVGFLDDSRALRGAKVHGVPVLGDLQRLDELAREVAAEMLLIAMPSASNVQMQRVVERCESTGLPFRTVPRLQDVVEGRSSFNELKEVAIEDLLGRDPVALDWTAIRTGLAGKRVLVSGGGGSIGSELCRQISRLGVESLTLIEVSEYNLYKIEQELRADFPDLRTCAGGVARRDGVPCGGLQARALVAGTDPRGGAQQRAGHPDPGAGLRPARGRELRADFQRQGGEPYQRDGGDQARGRDALPGAGAGEPDALRDGAFRQRARFGRQRGAPVPRADPARRAGDGDASGDHPLFHDHPGSLPTDPAGRGAGAGRRDLRARHG